MKTPSVPLAEAIDKKLSELRAECAVQRDIKANAFGPRWALAGGRGVSADKYWDDLQANAQRESTAAVETADRALAEFIAESRVVMGPDWIGNDHGRLCWDCFTGGRPIGRHYCERPEGHHGHHQNKAGAWPQNHEALELERRQRAHDHVQSVVNAIIAAEPSIEFGERDGPCIVEYRDWWHRGWPVRRGFSCLGCRHHQRDPEYRCNYCAHPTFLAEYKSHQSVANGNWWRSEMAEVHAFSCPVLKAAGVADHCPAPAKDEIPNREPSRAFRDHDTIFHIPAVLGL